MNSTLSSIFWVTLTLVLPMPSLVAQPAVDSPRARLIILADMGNEPDEEQQMAHMLMCCNALDLDALIAVTGKYLRPESRIEYRRSLHPELFDRLIDGYAKVLPNLKLRAQGWPAVNYLRSIVYAKANHHPVAAFNGDKSDTIVRRKALAGDELDFDASASTDPDGDELLYSWWHYEEAGTYPGRVFIENASAAKAKVHIPTGAGGKQIHIILEVRDKNPIASLRDYRREVVDVEKQIIELDSAQK
jgi:hypothetical protein